MCGMLATDEKLSDLFLDHLPDYAPTIACQIIPWRLARSSVHDLPHYPLITCQIVPRPLARLSLHHLPDDPLITLKIIAWPLASVNELSVLRPLTDHDWALGPPALLTVLWRCFRLDRCVFDLVFSCICFPAPGVGPALGHELLKKQLKHILVQNA